MGNETFELCHLLMRSHTGACHLSFAILKVLVAPIPQSSSPPKSSRPLPPPPDSRANPSIFLGDPCWTCSTSALHSSTGKRRLRMTVSRIGRDSRPPTDWLLAERRERLSQPAIITTSRNQENPPALQHYTPHPIKRDAVGSSVRGVAVAAMGQHGNIGRALKPHPIPRRYSHPIMDRPEASAPFDIATRVSKFHTRASPAPSDGVVIETPLGGPSLLDHSQPARHVPFSNSRFSFAETTGKDHSPVSVDESAPSASQNSPCCPRRATAPPLCPVTGEA